MSNPSGSGCNEGLVLFEQQLKDYQGLQIGREAQLKKYKGMPLSSFFVF